MQLKLVHFWQKLCMYRILSHETKLQVRHEACMHALSEQ